MTDPETVENASGQAGKPEAKPVRGGPFKWWQKRQEEKRFKRLDRPGVFRLIYESNKWRDAESRSGSGSSLAATHSLRGELRKTMDNLGIKSVLDLPCGDFNWMRTVDLSGIDYIGADIVPDLIEPLVRDYPQHEFVVLDICADPLPPCDLVLMRDLWVHLSFADAQLALANLAAGEHQYIATTTFPNLRTNVDKTTGKHRVLNMQQPPYSWPEPLLMLADTDGPGAEEKYLGIWRFGDITEAISRA